MRLSNKEIYFIRKIKEVFPGARLLTGLEAERHRKGNQNLKRLMADVPNKSKVSVEPLVMGHRKLQELFPENKSKKVSNKEYRLRNQLSLFDDNAKGAK